MTKEERNWCAYEKNEYLIFKSNLKNIDTLEVTDRNENYTNLNCNNVEVSFYQLNYIKLNLVLKSKKKSLLNCEISIMRDSDNENNHPHISIFGLKSDYPENGYKAIKQNLKLNTTNKIYKETYLFKDNISATNIEDGYLDEFYYDQKNGLLKYVAKNGESFELIKRIKQ
ncbi:hypothetical protein OX283_011245 [Flavobacterium sp. SUN052]|nr:hypothetical protein [Flavobacterium sp. SUN052]